MSVPIFSVRPQIKSTAKNRFCLSPGRFPKNKQQINSKIRMLPFAILTPPAPWNIIHGERMGKGVNVVEVNNAGYQLAKPVILSGQLSRLPDDVRETAMGLLKNEIFYDGKGNFVLYNNLPAYNGKLFCGSEAAIMLAEQSNISLFPITSLPTDGVLHAVSVKNVEEVMNRIGQVAISNNRMQAFVETHAPISFYSNEYRLLRERAEGFLAFLWQDTELREAVPGWMGTYF